MCGDGNDAGTAPTPAAWAATPRLAGVQPDGASSPRRSDDPPPIAVPVRSEGGAPRRAGLPGISHPSGPGSSAAGPCQCCTSPTTVPLQSCTGCVMATGGGGLRRRLAAGRCSSRSLALVLSRCCHARVADARLCGTMRCLARITQPLAHGTCRSSRFPSCRASCRRPRRRDRRCCFTVLL